MIGSFPCNNIQSTSVGGHACGCISNWCINVPSEELFLLAAGDWLGEQDGELFGESTGESVGDCVDDSHGDWGAGDSRGDSIGDVSVNIFLLKLVGEQLNSAI